MITVFCDGGSRGNPGHAAWGFVVKVDNSVKKTEGGYIGINTNNFAEYSAVLKAMEYLSKTHSGKDIHFLLDSNLVVSQLNGVFKIKNSIIREFVIKIRGYEPEFSKVTYQHIPREKNREADRQVNLALDRKIYGVI